MRLVLVTVSCALAASAAADPSVATSAATPAPRRHVVYAEFLGKGGAYGVGWDYTITDRLALGAAASFTPLAGQQIYTIAPYLHATLVRGRRHAMFGQLGFAVVHSRLPSPVPEWDGMADSGAGGQALLGWQWRPRRLVMRLSGGLAAGQHGVAPLVGVALGWSL